MKRINNRGLTLVELLAVVAVLSIIFVIATVSISAVIKNSKEKTRFIAASDIVEIASAYFEVEAGGLPINSEEEKCVTVQQLIESGYLEEDVTNPATGQNNFTGYEGSKVCYNKNYELQGDYKLNDNKYSFDKYYYQIINN